MDFLPGKCLLPQLMNARRLTPGQLAKLLGISIQEVSDHANRRKVMSLKNAKRYAHFFGVPIDDLYEWIDVTNEK